MIIPGEPCPWCGVRPDVGCRHREAVAANVVEFDGNGTLDRRKKGRSHSLFGKGGNPSQAKFDALFAKAKSALDSGKKPPK